MLTVFQPNLRDQLYIALDALRSLPASALNAVSEQLMSGIAKILEKERTVVKSVTCQLAVFPADSLSRSQTEWGLITALFRATVAHPEASKVTLELVRKTTSGAVGSGLTADNYQGMVAILDEFATAAGAAAMRVQHQRRGAAQPVAATLGPIVERGLAALDSLYDLRNVIPDLMKASSLTKVDGKCCPKSSLLVADIGHSLEYLLAASAHGGRETLRQWQPRHSTKGCQLPAATATQPTTHVQRGSGAFGGICASAFADTGRAFEAASL